MLNRLTMCYTFKYLGEASLTLHLGDQLIIGCELWIIVVIDKSFN